MPPDSVGSWTLATVAMWCDQCPGDSGCYELMGDKIEFDVLWNNGVERINEYYKDELIFFGKRIAKPHHRTVTRDFAKEVAEAVLTLRDKGWKFAVPAEDLHLVPGITKTGKAADNDVALATRIANLERSDTAILDTLRKMEGKLNSLASGQASSTPALQVNGTPANFGQALDRSRSRDGGNGAIPKKNHRGEPSPKRKREEAEAAGAEAAGAEDKKDDFATVVRRNNKEKQKPKVTYGKSKAAITAVAAVRPVDFFIAGTSTDCTEDMVKEVLVEVARTMPEGMELGCELEIESVTMVSKLREGQQKLHSKSWKVTVKEKFRTHMMRAESLPEGWYSRRFYPPRAPRPPPAGGALRSQLEILKQAEAAGGPRPGLGEAGYVPPGAPPKSA